MLDKNAPEPHEEKSGDNQRRKVTLRELKNCLKGFQRKTEKITQNPKSPKALERKLSPYNHMV